MDNPENHSNPIPGSAKKVRLDAPKQTCVDLSRANGNGLSNHSVSQESNEPDVVEAELVEIVEADLVPANAVRLVGTFPPQMENFAARGGAVASLFLGCWGILSTILTPIGVVNCTLGIMVELIGATLYYSIANLYLLPLSLDE